MALADRVFIDGTRYDVPVQDIKTARERFVMSECKNHYENIPAVSASAGLTVGIWNIMIP